MQRRLGSKGALVALSVCGLLALAPPASATTIPVPTGVVTGTVAFTSTCSPNGCELFTDFTAVRAAGITLWLAGVRMQLGTVSTGRIEYRSIQSFCPNMCGPTTPTLDATFVLSGRTVTDEPFQATCSSGDIEEAIPGVTDQILGLFQISTVSALCDGGTTALHGPFAFRFVTLTEPGGGFVAGEPARPFVGPLVDA